VAATSAPETSVQPARPGLVICADWSKSATKRSAWVGDVGQASIYPLSPPLAGFWTAKEVLDAAASHAGRTLVTFDAPLGVPTSYLEATRPVFGAVQTFVDLIDAASEAEGFFAPVSEPNDWSPGTPFFRVPAGKGSYARFQLAAARFGVDLKREVERRTRGNSVFAFGLPGQVGPAAQTLWKELAESRIKGSAFTIWPFEASSSANEVAEIYPRAAYGTALGTVGVPLSLAKTKAQVRDDAVTRLEHTSWVEQAGVEFHGLDRARRNEDDFDACLTAAALLRLLLENQQLADIALVDNEAEGAILAARSEQLGLGASE
jgi:hypothetical protein